MRAAKPNFATWNWLLASTCAQDCAHAHPMGDTSAAGWERPVAHVSVTLHKATTESLGLELGSGDLGQPVIHGIARDGVAAKDGQLRRGDELRTVNGAPCHTCAAAVSAIRAIGGAPTTLEINTQPRATVQRKFEHI